MKKLTLQLGLWKFSPGLISSLSTLLLIPVFVYLGFWQLDRSQEKKGLQQKLEGRLNEPVLVFDKQKEFLREENALSQFRFRRLKADGKFLNNQQILLDNQILQGQVGYRVITPFLPKDSTSLLLVDRGWIPMGKSRDELPILSSTEGSISIEGIINQPTGGLKLSKKSSVKPTWPLRVQWIDYPELSTLFHFPIYPFILQIDLKKSKTNDLNKFSELPISFGLSSDRHLGYAIQWFTIAFAVLLYYLVINSRRLKHDK